MHFKHQKLSARESFYSNYSMHDLYKVRTGSYNDFSENIFENIVSLSLSCLKI